MVQAVEAYNEPEQARARVLALPGQLAELNDRRDEEGLADPMIDLGEEHRSNLCFEREIANPQVEH